MLAAGAGRVGFAGTVGGVPVVTVVHGTLRTTYLPVAPLVRKGEEVHAGQPIGHLAEHPRHCAPRPCLHWGLLLGRDYMDPPPCSGRLCGCSLTGTHHARGWACW